MEIYVYANISIYMCIYMCLFIDRYAYILIYFSIHFQIIFKNKKWYEVRKVGQGAEIERSIKDRCKGRVIPR